MKEWRLLIESSQKGNEESTLKIIQKLEPKIRKSLYQTDFQERDNLEQELRIKTMTIVHSFDTSNVPGFWDWLDEAK
ncbi:helix-turn-helix domain-containing protein [Bacillus sp. H-16]|uniref:helix-turn-helix domain-containing protein n=1 Tax=Alteribacter salitolerans TaxID=2912333 RepID=UPI0019667FEF|nr:helix-turn-helix domain-containing protein [Alteribacter salitolerans]MBM7095738.1 helix-turn-helix domain-containing protein [Alteribacter salitolerans]